VIFLLGRQSFSHVFFLSQWHVEGGCWLAGRVFLFELEEWQRWHELVEALATSSPAAAATASFRVAVRLLLIRRDRHTARTRSGHCLGRLHWLVRSLERILSLGQTTKPRILHINEKMSVNNYGEFNKSTIDFHSFKYEQLHSRMP